MKIFSVLFLFIFQVSVFSFECVRFPVTKSSSNMFGSIFSGHRFSLVNGDLRTSSNKTWSSLRECLNEVYSCKQHIDGIFELSSVDEYISPFENKMSCEEEKNRLIEEYIECN
jgi:hypothetical protein